MQPTWNLVLLLLLFGIFWFFLIRPQQKRQREHQNMVANLEEGDQVITIGGIHGTVTHLNEDTVDLKITEDTTVTLNRQAIGQTQTQTGDADQNGEKNGEDG